MKKEWNAPKLAMLNVSKTKQGFKGAQEQYVPSNPHKCDNSYKKSRCDQYVS